MALSCKTAVAFGALILGAALTAPAVEVPVRHEHWRKGCDGVLVVDENGIRFAQTAAKRKPHGWEWTWLDVQRLVLFEDRLEVVTYKDVRWRLGKDRRFAFRAAAGHSFAPVYELLRDRREVKLSAHLADARVVPLWQIPVKRLGRIMGSEGQLKVGPERLVYETATRAASATWRYEQIEAMSRIGEDRLSLATPYGRYVFVLKLPLEETRYDELWRRVQRARGLEFPETSGKPAGGE